MRVVAKKDDVVIAAGPVNVDEQSTESVTSRLEKVSACENVSQGAKACFLNPPPPRPSPLGAVQLRPLVCACASSHFLVLAFH